MDISKRKNLFSSGCKYIGIAKRSVPRNFENTAATYFLIVTSKFSWLQLISEKKVSSWNVWTPQSGPPKLQWPRNAGIVGEVDLYAGGKQEF